MFGKSKYNKWNAMIRLLLLVVVFLLVFSIVFTILIPSRYEKYQMDYVDTVTEEINKATESNVVESVIELQNDYSFEAIIFEEETVIYSSNKMYDIARANEVYNDGYMYKGSFESNGYLVWMVVYNTSVSEFVNQTLTQNLLVIILQTILMLTVLYMVVNRSLRPLKRISQIIKKLKSDNNAININEDIDEISTELIKASNNLKLKLYYSKKEEEEFERRYTKQNELLYEQKNYLTNVVHDIKSTFAAIKFSSQFLSREKDLKEKEKKAINSIEKSSASALEFITDSLNNVINNEYDIYIEKGDVNVKEAIEKYFEFNSMLLIEKNLNVNVVGEDVIVETNTIKFDQIINNILSNMIKYAKEETELKIEISEAGCNFSNRSSSTKNEYSNSFGLKSIKNHCDDLNMEYDFKIEKDIAKSNLIYRGDKND